jgi:lysophospholipase L1-like esterase
MPLIKRLQFIIVLVFIPITISLILFIGWETYLIFQKNKEGTKYKYNNERVIKLHELNPGEINLVQMRFDPEHSTEMIPVGTDNLGFLLPSSFYEDPDITLAFMGDSITFGLAIKPEDRFPYVAGQLLEKKLSKKVRSLNAGVLGQDMIQSINILINKVLPQNPDYVFILPGQVDYFRNALTGGYWNSNSPPYIINKFSLANSLKYLKNIFFPNSYSATKKVFIKHWSSLLRKTKSQKTTLQTKSAQAIASPFKSALLSWVEISKSWGVTPVILAKPIKHYIAGDFQEKSPSTLKNSGTDKERRAELLQVFNQTVRDVAKETGAILIDLGTKFDLGPDKLHYDPKGSRMVAGIIADTLKKEIAKCQKTNGTVKCFGPNKNSD